MASRVLPLNNTKVNNAKPTNKPQRIPDGRGLYLIVLPNGTKVWHFVYVKPYTKKRTEISLGKYPIVSIAQARQKRDEYLTLLSQNIDPIQYKKAQELAILQKNNNTFYQISIEWKQKKRSEVAETTLSKNWRRLEKHVFPIIGNYPIEDIVPQVIISTLKKLDREGKSDTVKKLVMLINEIINFAVNRGILEFNKCYTVGKAFKKRKVINNPTIRPEELPAFLSALRNSNILLITKKLILWQLLTMVRPNEAASAEWSEIDFDNKLWTIPAKKMKTRSNDHIVPLSTQALDILQSMKEFNGHRKYIFASMRKPTQPLNSQTANRAIKLIGYGGKLTSHGLRAIASTYLNETFLDQYDVIEACLSHEIRNQVRKAYNRSNYLEQRKPIMQHWADYVESCAGGL